MKRLPRNLVANSIDAYVLSLETINRVSISYRMEAFCFLFCNAWELLMKAHLLHLGQRIFYRKKRKQARRSLTLDDCLGRIFTDANNPVRLNIAKIEELRNAAMHLVVPFVPPGIMGIFQAGVLNYSRTLQQWFGISVSSKVPLGMMSLVYDFDPEEHSLESAQLHRKLPTETVRWLNEFQQDVRSKALALAAESQSFYISIDLKLALVRNPSNADISLSPGTGGAQGVLIGVPKNADETHPYRQKDVMEQINSHLGGTGKIDPYDLQCVKRVYNVPNRPDFYYKSKFAAPQYSHAYIEWLKAQYNANPVFYSDARNKVKVQK